jgi:hypothetical protein
MKERKIEILNQFSDYSYLSESEKETYWGNLKENYDRFSAEEKEKEKEALRANLLEIKQRLVSMNKSLLTEAVA